VLERGLWASVDVLKRGVSGAKRQWAVEESSKKADDWNFKFFILPHCHDDQLDSVLTTLVKRGLWASVGKVLERGVSDEQLQWAVEWACTNPGDFIFRRFILPHCSNDQLEAVLTSLVERGLWKLVGKVMNRGVINKERHRDFVFAKHSHDDQVESWNLSDAKRQWAVEEASKKADDWDLRSFILPHCHDDQLDSVLTTLVKRDLWQSVGKVLERGVSDKQRQWAVEEARKKATGWNCFFYILPHCSEDQLNSVLTSLVERGLWESVGEVLERSSVSDAKQRWAV
jgi:hypothetical protein